MCLWSNPELAEHLPVDSIRLLPIFPLCLFLLSYLCVCVCLMCECVCVLYIVSIISFLPDHSFRSAIYWQMDFNVNEDTVWPSPHGAQQFIGEPDGP